MTSTLAAKVDPNFTQNLQLVGIVALALLVPGPEDVVLGAIAIKLASRLALRIGGRVAASLAERFAKACGANSFSSNTKVVLASGAMAAISTLGIGSNVLAFNQQTQTQGSYTVTATHKNLDPKVTYLTLKTHSEKRELIETTPEHPFMTSKGWVDAGKLKVGEKVREKGGYYGTVVFNKTIDRTQTMYNLTVATAHTFYVGSGQWLVHNCGEKDIDAFLDATGKVHGVLPAAKDFKNYSTGELQRLLNELKISVQTRIEATVRLGADYGHNARLAEEQNLIKSIEKHLGNR